MPTRRISAVQDDENPVKPDGAKIFADGEMADRIRGFRWQTTTLGSISGWSQTLLCAANLMLESQFPMLLIWGPEMVVLYNDACIPLQAERHPDALGCTGQNCWPEAWHILGPKLRSVFEQGTKLYFENELIPILRQGSVMDLYWTYSYSPVRDAQGEVSGIFVVAQDVTAKLNAERERDAIAANLKNVLESTTDGLVVLDNQARYTYVNDQAARIVASTPADMIGKSQWEMFPEAANTRFGIEYRQAVETGKPCHFDNFYPEPLNAWFECHCYPSEHGVSIYFRDVTEKKETEKELREREERFRALAESLPQLIWMANAKGETTYCNRRVFEYFGLEVSETNIPRWAGRFHPDDEERTFADWRTAVERSQPYQVEYRLRRHDGVYRHFLARAVPARNAAGEIERWIGTCTDIHDQKLAERELQEREERFRVLADSLPQLIWMTNKLGENTYCNQRYLDYLGVTEGERGGIRWLELIHPDDLVSTLNIWNHSVETGEPYLNEFRLRRKDGMFRYFLARAIPVKGVDGQVERWIGSLTDTHDQKLAEDALRKSEKLATAGRLAASIAHEINNPLEAVTNSLYLALQDASLDKSTKEYLEVAEQELRRVAQITTQTLRFHRQSKSPTPTDISDIVDTVLNLFGRRLDNKEIRVNAELERGAVSTCFSDEIRQVIANVVGNALDAMPHGGVLRVRVKKTRSWSQQRLSGVKIVIADSGHGIPAGVLERIFEPFVSTKEATGIGLGLWVSEGIVRKHGGVIRVRSRANLQPSGTVFAIFIPSA